MLTATRSLLKSADAGKELPRVEAFQALYAQGARPRHGQVIMVAGRSGAGKSAFALYWVAQMNLPTLYFSADMDASTVSRRLVSMHSGDTDAMVAAGLRDERTRQEYLDKIAHLNINFSFASPITWKAVEEELDAYVELWDAYPSVIVLDNLMDFANAESDYAEQMNVMQGVTEMARHTGSTVMILHHATDKSQRAREQPFSPPSRAEVKSGLAEKPELALSVCLDSNSHEYRVAIIKQRSGAQDPSAETYATLHADPATCRFYQQPLAAQLQGSG